MSKSLRPLACLGLVFLVGALVGCGGTPPTKPGEVSPGLPTDTLPAPPKPPEGWSKFQGEGFSVNVPDVAKFKRTPNGEFALPSNSWTNEVPPTPGQFHYSVTVDPLHAEGANAETDKMRTELKADPDKWWTARRKQMAETGEPIANDKRIPTPGGFGWRFTHKFGNGQCATGLAFTEKRVYRWMVMGEKQPDENDPSVKAFFDSFRIE